MTVRMRRATLGDLSLICRLRVQRTAWLTARGSDQWTVAGRGRPIEIFADAVGRALDAGQTWIAEVDDLPAGTITVNQRSDPGLWTRWELAESVIVHFMIVDLNFAGRHVGHHMLAHAAALAELDRRAWVRLDAWTTNQDLHAYYRRAGFRLARIAQTTNGPSCALFQRRTSAWTIRAGTRPPISATPRRLSTTTTLE
ncbi:GNAT family N-acetyltransferase [Nocardia caishijiensis]|uniref:Acetyltransferase (GNAT) family protein n=1 Tax=Nocardia caishijiensis TaxID=184756 RepID=A0ABQ6YRY4_9NOCA|nr:GNAT family N-acetyltransferase [Nocardia caishijiensis]KAF0848299.1 acetyltransferase (GNAT) family protein [Nocardia caishijiensis]